MARNSMTLMDFVGKLLGEEDVDVLREGIRVVADALMDAEVSALIGALPFERTEDRTAFRNGYRERRWDTRLGTVDLRIPKITPGSYFPSILNPRRRAEQALAAVGRRPT
jgi:transposase-like protein